MNISWICHFCVFCFSLRCTDQRSGLLMFIINSDYYYYYAYELAGKFQIHGFTSRLADTVICCYFVSIDFPSSSWKQMKSILLLIACLTLFARTNCIFCSSWQHLAKIQVMCHSFPTANSFPATWFQSP